jgi:hypothetical protein
MLLLDPWTVFEAILSPCTRSGVPSSSVADGARGTLREYNATSVLEWLSSCSYFLEALMTMTFLLLSRPSKSRLRSPNNLLVISSSYEVSDASQSSSSSSMSTTGGGP